MTLVGDGSTTTFAVPISYDEVKKLELTQFFNLTMVCLEKWFDVQIPFKAESIDDEFFEEFTDFTMEAGVFGYEGRSLGQSQVRKAEAKNAGSMRIKALIDFLASICLNNNFFDCNNGSRIIKCIFNSIVTTTKIHSWHLCYSS